MNGEAVVFLSLPIEGAYFNIPAAGWKIMSKRRSPLRCRSIERWEMVAQYQQAFRHVGKLRKEKVNPPANGRDDEGDRGK